MTGLHVYTGKGYRTADALTLNRLKNKTNIHDYIIHLGKADTVFFDYRKATSDRTKVIDQMISDLRVFLKEWMKSDLKVNRFFISLPAVNNDQKTMDNMTSFYADYKKFMSRAEDTAIEILGEDLWFKKGKGFYFRTETILPIQEQISKTSPTNNPMVQLLNDLAYVIRNQYDREFIWAPYYGYGDFATNINHNLGVIANRTNIFDKICIQPQYYFQGSKYKKNVDRVYQSMIDQEVVDEDGVPVAGGRKSSATAAIGVTMEGDDYFNGSMSSEFDYYINKFSRLMGPDHVFAFYAGETYNVARMPISDAINDFYEW